MTEIRRQTPSLIARAWRKLWVTLRGEASWIRAHGSLRDQERHGLIPRPNYAYGLLRAADVAKFYGKKKVTVCEFGVASGAGLLNMADLADLFHRETGVEYRVVGFDTGEGLPEIQGYKDHPELWSGGDFAMADPKELERKLGGRAELIFGDIGDTIDDFAKTLDPEAPLGFVSVDVDIYSGTKSAFRCLTGPAENYLPGVSFYFDDLGFFFANDWCGEASAIREFNEQNETRKFSPDRSLAGRMIGLGMPWCLGMYALHVLDHPVRQKPAERGELSIEDHHDFMRGNYLY